MRFGSTQNLSPNTTALTPELIDFLGQGRTVALLGSTGSIGTQGIEVIDYLNSLADSSSGAQDAPLRVLALSAGSSSLPALAQQAVKLRVQLVATSGSEQDAVRLRELIADAARTQGLSSYQPDIAYGPEASVQAASSGADVVLNGITGSIGLRPTLAALEAGSQVALANKESLIAGGALVRAAVDASPLEQPMVPVDSEHSALAQALASGTDREIDRLVLTASGGPFRGMSYEQLREVTPAQALAHPTWDMGLVVTTNSASMVNKALEVLEAHHLFGIDLDRIDVTVHRQSVVHSMVQFVDGSTVAQASPPTMLLPIALGLTWPHRIPGVAQPCDWTQASEWTFEPLDHKAFPAVQMIKQAGKRGGTFPAVFNAANEEAVAAFHAGAIRFTDMIESTARVLEDHEDSSAKAETSELTLDAVLEAERWARVRAHEILAR
ncbi:1-deoxy-D-xylulose-5-phosphate reductoisomerase [Rothia sp. P100]|uniref:1-deoxy-D-xylulose-5-phosphate reductoisomerase n=1 Tax=Rothia sp. P100 TaxID=2939578 RepID=UPI00203B3420|nr:1-deoxy-D-xylulose-5-phosphate reductoisomerase [Rothia sp. P100]MCM3511184.1 1-deoxy-D-xylulose-5-phosphate reductoisomerase [Rothia sp. P100]